MALVWKPMARSTSINLNKWSATQNYIVYDDANAALTAYAIHNAGITGGYNLFGAGDEPSALSGLLRNTINTYSPVEDGMDKIWSVSYQFESKTGNGVDITTVDSLTEQEVGFTSIETSISATTVDIYRTGATLPSDKSAPTLIDIAGTKVDSSGDPISYVLPMTNLSVRNVVYGRPSYGSIMALAGKTNNGSYTVCGFTAATHSLLFTGCSSSRTAPNTYEINFQFTYDPNEYHLRQVPLRDVDGRVMTTRVTPGSAVSEANPERADKVYYKQPFGTGDFTGLGIVST